MSYSKYIYSYKYMNATGKVTIICIYIHTYTMFAINFVTPFLIILSISYCKSDCHTTFSKLENILLLQNNEIVYANYNNKDIVIKNGDYINAACPGTTIHNYNTEDIQLQCVNNKYPVIIEDLTCTKKIEAIEIQDGTCLQNNLGTSISIGFKFQTSILKLDRIKVCWNDSRKLALYAHAKLTKALSSRCSFTRPSYFKSNYFPKDLAKWYEGVNQLANKNTYYAPLSAAQKKIILHKGHLISFCDFPYKVEQLATNFYTNTAPQWSTFNQGNWLGLENNVRKLIETRKIDLEVYTGTYGIMKLNGKDYYLDREHELAPVPRYFWKVLIDERSQLGIAIIGSNDIFDANQTPPCTDVLNHVTWLKVTNARVIEKGYLTACTVDDFKNIPGIKSQLPTFPTITGPLY